MNNLFYFALGMLASTIVDFIKMKNIEKENELLKNQLKESNIKLNCYRNEKGE